jgi:hypothetical protein
MEDPVLNRNLGEVKELQTRWNQFRDFVRMAMSGQPLSAQMEMKFMELKSRIAMLHDSLMSTLQHDQKVGANMMNLLNDIIMLKKAARATDAEKQKFEFDWNELYMLVNENISAMEEEVRRLGAINESAYRSAQRRELMKARLHRFLTSKPLHALLWIVGIVGGISIAQVTWGFQNLHNYGWSHGGYVWVVNTIWRPFLNHEYEYDEFLDIPFDDYDVSKDVNGNPRPVAPVNSDDLNYDVFLSDALKPFGLPKTQFAEMKKLADTKLHFDKQRLKANNNDVEYYYLLMPTSKAAQDLVTMWTNSIKDNLPADQQQAVKKSYFIFRRANAIYIGESPTEIFREENIRLRFKLDIAESGNVLDTVPLAN